MCSYCRGDLLVYFVHVAVLLMTESSAESQAQLGVIVRGHKSRALRGASPFLMINPI